MRPGDTFRFRVPDYHFAVVVAECPHDRILVVRITKPLPWKDQSCPILKSEFTDLDYDSLIDYEDSFVGDRTKITALEAQGLIQGKTPVGAPVVQQILASLAGSDATARVKRFVAGPTCCP